MDVITLITLAILALLTGGVIVLIWRQFHLQASLASGADSADLQQRCTVLEQQLRAREEELEREKLHATRRADELAANRDRLQQKLDTTVNELSQHKQDLATVQANLKKIPELTTERDEARSRLEQTRNDLSALRTAHQALKSETAKEQESAAEKLKAL